MTEKAHKSAFDAIFDDDKELAENLKIRAELLAGLSQFIADKFGKDKEAATFFGEPASTISALKNCKYERFTIDKLVLLSVKAGLRVKLTVKPAKRAA